MKYLAFIVLVGCGRLGFAPSAGADDDAQSPIDMLTDTPSDTRVDLDGLFAGCMHETFDVLGPEWQTFGDMNTAENGVLRSEIQGPLGSGSWIQQRASRSMLGWTTILQVVQPCAQVNTNVGIGWHGALGPAHLSIVQGQLRLDSYTGGIVQDAYDPVDDRWLRLRESNGLLWGATSPDGVTWNEFGAVSFTGSDVFVDMGAEASLITVNPDFALFDDYIECPPS